MGEAEKTTLAAIHKAATAEFLEKGFKSASLRNIVKSAGVTTGAFYGYYDSKEELFEALVGEKYDYFISEYKNAQEKFAELPESVRREKMSDYSSEQMEKLFLYAYENLSAFKLILLCSEGTRFSNLIDELTEIESVGTHEFYKSFDAVPTIDPQLEHILITGMFKAYFEIIIHEMPPDDALKFIKQLHNFYLAGWLKIMGQA